MELKGAVAPVTGGAEFAAPAERVVADQMLNGEVVRPAGALRMGPR
jgi:hypothetical protein